LPLVNGTSSAPGLSDAHPSPVLPPMLSYQLQGPSRLSPDYVVNVPTQPSMTYATATGTSLTYGRPTHAFTSPLAYSMTPSSPPLPSPTLTESPIDDSEHTYPCTHQRNMSFIRRTPTLRSPASTSTLAYNLTADMIPSTPTTPTRHYPGRPLPQLPGPPFPFTGERSVNTQTPMIRNAVLFPPPSPEGQAGPAHGQYAGVTDLDVLAARVLEDGHDGRNYENLLRIEEFAGPAAHPAVPTTLEPHLALPPSGRVKLERRRVTKDGRVKLKLTLMGVVVDKCSICLSQFKDTEVACLGTHCRHAFHEYCLKCWIVKSRTCPLCRAEV